ncbi:universal stress protein [Actinoplanes siamensis]|uniref:Universal stress protein n=1 Tax=Actinoplanes siamensis TaxID=1223317 RepID=A0A919K867_9ACTN|nr:universal stress protein [Actinoplanes siamensis]GIF02766.1 universal stress protein [Actinoplanes siamensis]
MPGIEEINGSEVRDGDIVVGMDGSVPARQALSWAAGQARLTGSRLHVIAAWDLPAYHGWAPVVPSEENPAETAGKMMSVAVRDVLGEGQPDLKVAESILPGHPAQVLIDASAHAALLVLGCRGLGSFAGALIGSVSQQCVQHAHCPVVVVRGTGQAPFDSDFGRGDEAPWNHTRGKEEET